MQNSENDIEMHDADSNGNAENEENSWPDRQEYERSRDAIYASLAHELERFKRNKNRVIQNLREFGAYSEIIEEKDPSCKLSDVQTLAGLSQVFIAAKDLADECEGAPYVEETNVLGRCMHAARKVGLITSFNIDDDVLVYYEA